MMRKMIIVACLALATCTDALKIKRRVQEKTKLKPLTVNSKNGTFLVKTGEPISEAEARHVARQR